MARYVDGYVTKYLSLIAIIFLAGFSAHATSISEEVDESEGSYEFVCEGDSPGAQAVMNCRFDTDCRFNEKCQYGRCVDRDSCSTDYDCNYGNICEFGRCKMAECRGGPYDCRAGQQCRNGRCETDPMARRCIRNEDCPTYERCSMGYCQ